MYSGRRSYNSHRRSERERRQALDGSETMSWLDALDVTGPNEGGTDEITALPPIPAQSQLVKGRKAVKKAKNMML
jgi:hypothetical protein